MSEEDKKGSNLNETGMPDEPQIYSVSKEMGSHTFSRRQFIEASAVTAGVVMLTGCIPGAQGLTGASNPIIPTQTKVIPPSPTNTATPAPTATTTLTPTNTATPAQTNTFTTVPSKLSGNTTMSNVVFRSGPGTGYSPVTTLSSRVHFNVIGRTQDNQWVHVVTDDKKDGWLKMALTDLKFKDLATIPTEVPPPTPTPLPGRSGDLTNGHGMNYEYTDQYGNKIDMNQDCGQPLPDNSVCTCNCVDAHPNMGGAPGHYWYPN